NPGFVYRDTNLLSQCLPTALGLSLRPAIRYKAVAYSHRHRPPAWPTSTSTGWQTFSNAKTAPLGKEMSLRPSEGTLGQERDRTRQTNVTRPSLPGGPSGVWSRGAPIGRCCGACRISASSRQI
ncbi:unnamed protein product, partial [Gadus morhua 'NCC']